ncbi:unnamed protein product [Paramecium sonneborni]|uniref:Transmembrane protein n=1 Tax=Paramecium sonneborni TaxID=65129 RepID=A0A8S1JZ28_9CILI|nr:unnamed protein product [Paramecium sonneborni]
MNRKIIAIFFIFLTLGSIQAKEDSTKQIKCQKYDKDKIFNCIKLQINTAIAYQSISSFSSFIIIKLSIWLAGFTAAGPIAGSLAAWIQSLIGNVVAGSFFSWLQAVAMGKTFLLFLPSLTIGTIVAIIYLVFNCFRSEFCIQEQKQNVEQIPNRQRDQKKQAKTIQQEEQSFWSSSVNIIKSGISNTYSTISKTISEVSNQLPSMPKEVLKFQKQIQQFSSDYLQLPESITQFSNSVLEYSSQIATSVQNQLKENNISVENAFNYLTKTFDDFVVGMYDLFEFISLHKEIIQESFEYIIQVLEEQYTQYQEFSKYVENSRQSKKKNACTNSFIEYLANQ